jgi:hypothetical protein|tara:strand:- start:97 stop:1173 length:1077 start_codon:yes stop_codon:yes gene_type:complete
MKRFITLLLVLISFSCDKSSDNLSNDNSSNFLDGNLNDKTAIVAGSTVSDGAVVWINNKKIVLMGDATDAMGLFYDNNKVYITGWKYGGTAFVWTMDIDGSNQTVEELPGKFSEGQRIIVQNGDVYVGGYFDNGSCYWKNGNKINLTTNADSMSWGIEVDNNEDIYTAGYYMNDDHVLIPSFWKNTKRTKLSRPNGGDGEAKYVKLKDNKKIFGGTVMVPHNFLGYLTKPSYWINGSRKSCGIGSVDDGWQGSDVFSMFVDDNDDVYLGGFSQDMNAERPTIWKNCEKILLPGLDENNQIVNPSESSGVVRSILKEDNKIIAAGTIGYWPGVPCIWVDSKPYVYDISLVGEVWDMIII